jgi:hypothetical protein
MLTSQTALLIEIVIGIATIVTGIGAAVKWLTKHYFDEIRSEIRPNSGSSLKDQVTRLEVQMTEANYVRQDMNNKIDRTLDLLLTHIENTKK